MKKSLIAGAGVAALAMAALPFAGVFAETTVQDNIMVTVSSACELANITPASAATTGNNYYGSGAPGELVTINPGTKQSSTGAQATSITVHCNDPAGYTISTNFSDLLLNGVSSDQDIEYSATTVAAANSQTWTAYNGSTVINPANGLGGESTMTDSYTFSYKAGLGADQAAGDYTGTAVYTLAGNTTP